ncbi:hypothetical protein BCR39DRAFT_148558 [Naematelia encephala]|uniref:BIR-domain-containing protein n=1 Tax=Naematelia encephala TaxID=71784 RepID=A0A1Y2B8A9_9TREE|nr:hypothetical protein BCR39DRAFT_148558 [Naematelia encephala]
MQHLDARIASFKPVLRPKSRAKPSFPLSASTHPLLTPQNLAEAGFYHLSDQSDLDTPDSCKCFTCGLHLGGWDSDDDPHEEHVKRDNGCVWAEAVCRPKVEKTRRATDPTYQTVFLDAESLPGSSKSAAMREATYGKWWPHKARSGIPTPKQMAQAGFLYYGSTDSLDCVLCPWCEYSAEGWEPGDDPLEIHQSKSADCRFFIAVVEEASVEAETSKASRSTKSQTTKKSKRQTTVPSIPIDSQSEAVSENEAAEVERPASPVKSRRATRARPTTTKAKSGRGKQKAETVELEVDISEEEELQETASVAPTEVVESQVQATTKAKSKPRKPRATKASSKKGGAPEGEVEKTADTEEAPPSPPRATQLPISSVAPTESEQQSVPSRTIAPKPSKSTRPSKASSSQPRAPHAEEELKLKQPLTSQLDRFVNIPPSSPIPIPIAPLSKSQPSIQSTKQPQPHSSAGKVSPLPSPKSKSKSKSASASISRSTLDATLDNAAVQAQQVILSFSEQDLSKPLSENEKKMTLEEMVKFEYKRRYDQMKKEGEEMIRLWQQRASEGRKKIEAI